MYKRIEHEKFLKCLEYANINILIVQNFNVVFYNTKFSELFGYSEEDIKSKDFLKNFISLEEDYLSLKELHRRRLEEGYSNEEIFVVDCMNKKRNKIFKLKAISYGVIWDDKPASLIFFWDVTDQEKDELGKIYFKYIFENSPKAFDVCLTNGMIIDTNKKSEELWGFKREDFIGKVNFFKIDRIKNNKKVLDLINKAIETKEIQKSDIYACYNNLNKQKYVETTIYPVSNSFGEVKYFVVINDDYTEIKKRDSEKEALYQDLIRKNNILENLQKISKILMECDESNALNQVLQISGEVLDVSRSYIFEISPVNNKITYKYEWVNSSTEPHINDQNLSNITLKELGFEDWEECLNSNKVIKILDTRKNLPPKQKEILFDNQNIISLLVLPIFLPNHVLYGFIGFDECRYQRKWLEYEINILKNLSNLIGSFIKKCNMEKRLNNFLKDQSIILDNLDSYVWFFKDYETYGFVNNKYYNDFILKGGYDFKTDCMLIDCNFKEYSEQQIITNRKVFQEKKKIEYIQEMKDVNDNTKVLRIKKIPVFSSNDNNNQEEVEYIVCIAKDITEEYYKEREMVEKITKQFKEKMLQIDRNIQIIHSNLRDSRSILEKVEARSSYA